MSISMRSESKSASRRNGISVLAVGAHPDDIEVGCFGTLLKHVSYGGKVTIAVTTKGGYGKRTWEQICRESKEASKILGADYTILNNRIGHYEMTWKTVSEIDDLIAENSVNTVYTVWHGDSHQDHQLTFKNVLAACRTKKIENLFCFEQSEYSYRSQATFDARYFVDITDFIEKKLRAIKAYKSYITPSHLEAVRGLARHRGLACGAEYAEAFEPIFTIWK
jgi:LmbE family N-acetylglucosaminyl deacetylase